MYFSSWKGRKSCRVILIRFAGQVRERLRFCPNEDQKLRFICLYHCTNFPKHLGEKQGQLDACMTCTGSPTSATKAGLGHPFLFPPLFLSCPFCSLSAPRAQFPLSYLILSSSPLPLLSSCWCWGWPQVGPQLCTGGSRQGQPQTPWSRTTRDTKRQ